MNMLFQMTEKHLGDTTSADAAPDALEADGATTTRTRVVEVRLTRFARFLGYCLLAYLGLSYFPHLGHRLNHACAHVRESIGYSLDKYDAAYFADFVECPEQPEPLFPPTVWDLTDDEKEKSAELYSQAVRIPTQSYDDNGEPTEDPRWGPFFSFQKWLKGSFPLAHEKGKVEYINSLGIIATWQGSDPSLKPLMLMSHYDVVPVPNNTLDQWKHGPFSGDQSEGMLWGRGAADDKTLVVAQWEGITRLLENGFEPRRTLIFAHGFDEEEVFRSMGAGHIAPVLEERYGKDGILMIIDEGAGNDDNGGAFAMPGMGEKGYMDIKITVGTGGGHSSTPPEHTGIGIMSQLVNALESNPFPIKFTPASPVLTALKCAAKYSPDFPSSYAKLLRSPKGWHKLAKLFGSKDRFVKGLTHTTQAVDVVVGGGKVNALPEHVEAFVNYRIDFDETIETTQDHIVKVLKPVAREYDLDFSAFSSTVKTADNKSERFVSVELSGQAWETAPRTPSNSNIFELFAGTLRAILPGPDGQERIVTPYASTGNTDTKVYHNLSRHIYRYMGSQRGGGIHTVNEFASLDDHYNIVRWIHAIIQNADRFEGN